MALLLGELSINFRNDLVDDITMLAPCEVLEQEKEEVGILA